MKIVISTDSFKGALSSTEAIDTIALAAQSVFSTPEIIKVPIADGGEGTINAILSSTKGEVRYVRVKDPLGRWIDSYYGVVNDTAIIEMANCSGLTLLKQTELNPLMTSSYGLGQMILEALNDGFRKIFIGIGGSATNDGGTGAMEALGVRFTDVYGMPMSQLNGNDLKAIHAIHLDKLDARIQESEITVMCDVTNPLVGPNGATKVYGPQKGATPEMIEKLESGMNHYGQLLNQITQKNMCCVPGAGAAGGMGAALMAFLSAKLISGIQCLLEMVDFEAKIQNTDMVISGEGSLDTQSLYGKVISGIAAYTKPKKIPLIAFVGQLQVDQQDLENIGVHAAFAIQDGPLSLQNSIEMCQQLLYRKAYQVFKVMVISNPIINK